MRCSERRHRATVAIAAPVAAVAELGSLDQLTMETTTSQIAEYLQRFRNGDRDGAFYGLVEMEHGVLPELMATFRSERDSRVREFLVEVIWQHRQASAIPFLKEALNDGAAAVWKQALDGLVTLASSAALEVLRDARTRQFTTDREMEEFRHWLDEAIEQAESEIQRI
jgi:HEAT repeat protein